MIGTYRIRKKIERRIFSRSGWMARSLRGNIPYLEAWRRPIIDISRSHGLGDVLLSTPALREIKRLNPKSHIRFYTKYPSLLRGLPYINEVFSMEHCPKNAIRLLCEDSLPSTFHISQLMGDCLGVNVTNIMPDCVVNHEMVKLYRARWGREFTIVVSLESSGFAPNKNWPIEYWDELIQRISKKFHVILIGNKTENDMFSSKMVTDMRGKTSLEDLIAIVASGNFYVGPMTGPYHIAAATGCPSLVILGGYESPNNACYPGSIVLSSNLPCSPCWLSDNCPHSKLCLTSISVDLVENKIINFFLTKGNPTSEVSASRMSRDNSKLHSY